MEDAVNLEQSIDEFGQAALRVKRERDELVLAASDFAKLVMVENFPTYDIAVTAAYDRLRVAIAKATA
jgi:hypothetical protein